LSYFPSDFMMKFVLALLLIPGLVEYQDSQTVAIKTAQFSTLEQHQTLTINADFSFSLVVEKKITVLTPDGLDHALTRLFYDKLNEVKSFDLEVVDPTTGKSIKKAKLKDMNDVAYYSSSSVFDDNRFKYYEVSTPKYPVEVRIRSEVSSKTNFNLPKWSPVPHYNQKVTESSFTVRYPSNIGLNYKEVNLSDSRRESEEAGISTITWTEKDLAVQSRDLDHDDDLRLFLAPVKFAVDQYRGEIKDWAGLASWQFELNKDRDVLPRDFETKILALVEGIDEPYEKIKILYSYLQKNYRYVSIQLGIGGWQTMTAADVVKYSYGDCKGLTNLMKAMLDLVGIPSNYTLVYAGADVRDIEVDLPSNQFNHVILQVPTPSQPVWLECTSTLLPAGYLGDFTKNRHVLVTQDGGGYLTKTPSYDSEEWNSLHSRSKLVIDARGDASISTQQLYLGNFAEELFYVKSKLDERQQRDYLNRNSSVSGLIVKNYQIEETSQDSVPTTNVTYDGYLQKFSQASAKRIMLRPFLGKLEPSHLANKSLKQVDEYEIELPEAWQPDGDFPKIAIEEENLKASLKVSLEGKILRIHREIALRLPDDLEKEDETQLLKKLNTAFNKSLLFKHEPLTTLTDSPHE
jgi:transglutaminase-like putative cysteine protease